MSKFMKRQTDRHTNRQTHKQTDRDANYKKLSKTLLISSHQNEKEKRSTLLPFRVSSSIRVKTFQVMFISLVNENKTIIFFSLGRIMKKES